MKASQRSLTLVESSGRHCHRWVVLAGELDFTQLARKGERKIAKSPSARRTLVESGTAIAAYREDNGSYFPFSWQRAGESEPMGTGAASAAMAATSLGNLYPRYVEEARIFRCPSVEDQPSFVLNRPLEYRGANPLTFLTPPEGSNWTLTSNMPVSMPPRS